MGEILRSVHLLVDRIFHTVHCHCPENEEPRFLRFDICVAGDRYTYIYIYTKYQHESTRAVTTVGTVGVMWSFKLRVADQSATAVCDETFEFYGLIILKLWSSL